MLSINLDNLLNWHLLRHTKRHFRIIQSLSLGIYQPLGQASHVIYSVPIVQTSILVESPAFIAVIHISRPRFTIEITLSINR